MRERSFLHRSRFSLSWLRMVGAHKGPAARPGEAAGVSHDGQRVQTCIFEGHGDSKTPPNSTRRPPREVKCRAEEGKNERSFGRSREGGSTEEQSTGGRTHNTTQHNTTQHNTTQHNTPIQQYSNTTTVQQQCSNSTTTIQQQYNTTPHHTTPHHATQRNTTQRNATQHNTTTRNTTPRNTTRNTQHAIQHITTQYNTQHTPRRPVRLRPMFRPRFCSASANFDFKYPWDDSVWCMVVFLMRASVV